MGKYFMLCIMFATTDFAYCQQKLPINQYDSTSKKDGFWIEKYQKLSRWEGYYRHGRLNGVYKIFNDRGDISMLGFYHDDTITGYSLMFDENGRLFVTEDSISKNTWGILDDSNKLIVPPFKSYVMQFYPNGRKSKEGWLLYFDSPLMDDAIEYGVWKFYDEREKETEIVDWKNNYLNENK